MKPRVKGEATIWLFHQLNIIATKGPTHTHTHTHTYTHTHIHTHTHARMHAHTHTLWGGLQ